MSWAEQSKRLAGVHRAEISRAICTDEETARAFYDAEQLYRLARASAVERLVSTLGMGDQADLLTTTDLNDVIEADPDVTAKRDALDAARVKFDDASVVFTFRGLRPYEWEALIVEHPARDGDDRDRAAGYNRATFAPALLAATHVYYEPGPDGGPVEQPGMDLEEATEIWRTWSAADANELFEAAVAVCTTSRLTFATVGKGSGPTRS